MLSVSDKRTLKSIKPAKDITVSVNTYDSNQIKTVLDATTVITDTTDATHTVSLTLDVSSYDQTKTGDISEYVYRLGFYKYLGNRFIQK